jgi:hypothetical protein
LSILVVFVPGFLYAQLKITDFSVFGSNGQSAQNAPNCFVQFGSSVTINGGSIGSNKLVKTTGGINLTGNIYSGGTVVLANSNKVTGRITAANTAGLGGTILSVGSSAIIGGNIDVNGNIVVSGGTISGKVTHPDGTSYLGPVPGGGNIIGAPSLPTLPALPAITNFPAAGSTNISANMTIVPGAYGRMQLGGNKTITLAGPGVYVFKSIKNSGTSNNFVFDFKNTTTGNFYIYVHEDVDLGKVQATTKNGGNASRIFSETHGTGTTIPGIAWNIANGSSGANTTRWLGTIWASHGAINVGAGSGSSQITGALWSATQVIIQSGVTLNFAPFILCEPPHVNAGSDKPLDFSQTTVLTATSTTPGATFSWQALNGGVITPPASAASITVTAAGTYVVTATSGSGCSSTDTVIVTSKVNNLIGSELKSIFDNFTPNAPPSPFFVILHDSIIIEVIVKENKYAQTLALLLSAEYGMTDIIPNGNSNYIITGKFPIANLVKLNLHPDLINYVRPLFLPLKGNGIATTQGDQSLRSDFLRNGFNLNGDSIKVGVLSDSYNTLPGDPASTDVSNGDLPGVGNSENSDAVEVIKEYPLGRSGDEGRAMLQIIHDIAPKAKLAFRTGFVSAGDLAQGIRELQNADCDVMVDDITFITEPFFQDGVVSQAVNEVSAQGVAYFTSAGNFANKSYASIFNPTTPPAGVAGTAHNFGGNIYQSVTLNPGVYTIVMQWADPIYSLGQTSTGTLNDFDIYLTNNGTSLFGFNRNNIGGDPIEVLPFTVAATTTTNILITRNSGIGNVWFKYIIFRGDAVINTFNSGNSTIVGQANAEGAFTIGAVRYNHTPAYGVNPPQIESFSSYGGTPVNNQVRNKPDFTAPDGVNTSVNFGSPDFENDGLPNFFGTSAAAPHAAAVAALIKQARKRYYGEDLNNGALRELLTTTALDMGAAGFDFVSGNGFIRADEAIKTFAAATPSLVRLIIPEGVTPGPTPFEVTVTGNYLSPNTKVIFRQDTLTSTFLNDSSMVATVPAFIGNPSITAYTPPLTPAGSDGGLSNAVTFYDVVKKNVKIVADNKTMKYGERLPEFTATITVDDVPLGSSGLSPAQIGMDILTFTTPANSMSNVNKYVIKPVRPFDPENPVDVGFNELYSYVFTDGILDIQKMPLVITPRDTVVTYGEKIGNIKFNYEFPTEGLDDATGFLNNIVADHQAKSANDVIGLVNRQAVTIVNGKAIPIVNGQAVTIVNGQAVTIVNGQAIPIVNRQSITIVNGQAIPIVNNLTEDQMENVSFLASEKSLQNARQITNKKLVNGTYVTETTNVVDITQESILDFNTNSAQTYLLSSVSDVNARGLVDVESLTSRQAVTIVNGQAVTIVNGQAVTIVNGQAVTIVNRQAVTIVNGQAIPIVNGDNRTAVVIDEEDLGQGITPMKSINMITGLTSGLQNIIPAALLNDNFDVTYGLGNVTIIPAPITIKAKDTTKVYGEVMNLNPKAFTISEGEMMFDESVEQVSLSSAGVPVTATAGTHPIIPTDAIGSEGTDLANYTTTYANGILTVTKGQLIVSANSATKVYGDPNPVFSANYTGFMNGETLATSNITGAPSFTTAATITSGVGSYPITVGLGSLVSTNYHFTFQNGTALLSVTKAPLNVVADDKVIYFGDPLPTFTSKLYTLKAGDNAVVSYTLSPYCTGSPGVYSIIPRLVSFTKAANYTITYTNGSLYINPKGNGAKKLRPYLDCVEEVQNPSSPATRYIAHFYVINDNKTALYVPIGIDNAVTGTGSFNASQQPKVFQPGKTYFDVPFDGTSLRWELKTYDTYKKTAVATTASLSSSRCSYTTTTTAQRGVAVNDMTVEEATQIAGKNVYPNPASKSILVYLDKDEIDQKGMVIFDVTGKQFPVKITGVLSTHGFRMDVSGLAKGMYFLRVKTNNGLRVVKILKE